MLRRAVFKRHNNEFVYARGIVWKVSVFSLCLGRVSEAVRSATKPRFEKLERLEKFGEQGEHSYSKVNYFVLFFNVMH